MDKKRLHFFNTTGPCNPESQKVFSGKVNTRCLATKNEYYTVVLLQYYYICTVVLLHKYD